MRNFIAFFIPILPILIDDEVGVVGVDPHKMAVVLLRLREGIPLRRREPRLTSLLMFSPSLLDFALSPIERPL